jgi:hypothetical protein
MESIVDERNQKREFLWFLMAFVVAASLRFIKLGSLALGSDQAAQAMQTLGLVRGTVPIIEGSPSYMALTSILFTVFSASGFWACFWPAAFGSLVVFVPLLFRDWFGGRGTVLLAFFLALDPGLIAVSRNASGMMITLVSFLVFIGALKNRRTLLAGIAAGLVILGGVCSWPILIAAILITAIFFFSLPAGERKDKAANSVDWKTLAISTFATVILLGTVFFIRPSVINGIGAGFYQYFSGLASGEGVSLKVMLISLPITELFTLPLTIWGIIIGLKNKDALTEFLSYSAGILLLLCLLNSSRHVTDWVWTIVPLTMLAVKGLDDLLRRFKTNEMIVTIIQAVITAVLIIFSFLNLLSTINNPPVDSTATGRSVLEILMPLIFLAVVSLLLSYGWSMGSSRQGLIIGVGALFLFVTIGTSWKAAGLGLRPEAELWRSDALPVGCGLVQKSASTLGLMTNGLETRIDISLIGNGSQDVEWCLRDFDKLSSVVSVGKYDSPSIIIGSSDSQINPVDSYSLQRILWTSVIDYDNMSASEWIKWFVSRNSPTITTMLNFWARNDLFTEH